MGSRRIGRWVLLLALIGIGFCYAEKASGGQTTASLSLDDIDERLQVTRPSGEPQST